MRLLQKDFCVNWVGLDLDTMELALQDDRVILTLKETLIAHRDEGTRFENHEMYPYRFQTYRCYFSGYVNGRRLHVRYSPRHNGPRGIFQFHMSHFSDFQELVSWLGFLSEEHLAAVLEARPTRCDLCVDVAIPFDAILSCIYRSRTGHVVRYNGKKRSIALGERPYRTNIYQKEFNLLLADYVPASVEKEDRLFLGTRIESQFSGEKIPVLSLADLAGNYREVEGFPKLQLKSPLEFMGNAPNLKQKRLCEAFLYNVQLHGLHVARNEFNRGSRNFSRTIERFLAPVDLNVEAALQYRMKRYFQVMERADEGNFMGRANNGNGNESEKERCNTTTQ